MQTFVPVVATRLWFTRWVVKRVTDVVILNAKNDPNNTNNPNDPNKS